MVIIWYICAHSRIYIHSASIVLSLCFKVKGQQDEIAIIEAIFFLSDHGQKSLRICVPMKIKSDWKYYSGNISRKKYY